MNYLMEENLFLYVDWLPVAHAASRFPVRKNISKKRSSQKKKKKKKEKGKRKKEMK